MEGLVFSVADMTRFPLTYDSRPLFQLFFRRTVVFTSSPDASSLFNETILVLTPSPLVPF